MKLNKKIVELIHNEKLDINFATLKEIVNTCYWYNGSLNRLHFYPIDNFDACFNYYTPTELFCLIQNSNNLYHNDVNDDYFRIEDDCLITISEFSYADLLMDNMDVIIEAVVTDENLLHEVCENNKIDNEILSALKDLNIEFSLDK